MTGLHTSTPALFEALDILSRKLQTDDGMANAALAEASQRLSDLYHATREAIGMLREASDALQLSNPGHTREQIQKAVLTLIRAAKHEEGKRP